MRLRRMGIISLALASEVTHRGTYWFLNGESREKIKNKLINKTSPLPPLTRSRNWRAWGEGPKGNRPKRIQPHRLEREEESRKIPIEQLAKKREDPGEIENLSPLYQTRTRSISNPSGRRTKHVIQLLCCKISADNSLLQRQGKTTRRIN